jgi:hypothetical protein
MAQWRRDGNGNGRRDGYASATRQQLQCDGEYNNQLATVAMDGAMATQRQRQ